MNHTQILRTAFVALVALSFSGCPVGQSQVSPGVWLLEYDASNITAGLVFFADGSVAEPVPLPTEADASLAGFLVWEQNGDQFILSWMAVETVLFIAQVNSGDSLSGTWVNLDQGTYGAWSARRVG